SGAGAQAVADGMDVGGALAQPQNSVPDIEINELGFPVLYLWRKLNTNSGGPGKYRGGDGVDLAWTPWYTPGGQTHVFGACWQVPPSGTAGGYPGSTSGFHLVSGAGADKVLASGQIPGHLDELDGDLQVLEASSSAWSARPATSCTCTPVAVVPTVIRSTGIRSWSRPMSPRASPPRPRPTRHTAW